MKSVFRFVEYFFRVRFENLLGYFFAPVCGQAMQNHYVLLCLFKHFGIDLIIFKYFFLKGLWALAATSTFKPSLKGINLSLLLLEIIIILKYLSK